MKNLSSLSKANRFNIAAVIALLIVAAYVTYIYGFESAVFVLLVINVALALLIYFNIQKQETILQT